MIVYKKGDILASDEKVIAHGVNCTGGFGSGFAKQIKAKYPEVRTQYMLWYDLGHWETGYVQKVRTDDNKIVANCSTQYSYGPITSGPYVSYVAIRKCIRQLVEYFPNGWAMPKIGAGLAGGNWDIIEQIVNEEIGDIEVRVYIL